MVSVCAVRRNRAFARTSLANSTPLVMPAIARIATTNATPDRINRVRNLLAMDLDSRVQRWKGKQMAELLLVEDDAAIAGPLLRALERAGHATRWVTTGGDAETAVFDDLPELVVLDLGLPDIDGLDVCRHLRAVHERLPVIVLTARGEELDIVEGFEAGADDYRQAVPPQQVAGSYSEASSCRRDTARSATSRSTRRAGRQADRGSDCRRRSSSARRARAWRRHVIARVVDGQGGAGLPRQHQDTRCAHAWLRASATTLPRYIGGSWNLTRCGHPSR